MPLTPDPMAYAEVRRAYDTVAADYAAYLPDTRAEARLDLAMVDAFADAVSTGEDPIVLDAGCGAGRLSRYVADRGCRTQGVDLSPGMIAMARRDHPDLGFAVGSLTALPFARDRFAGVLLWYSIIHTPPSGLAQVCREAARVLRRGGHLLVGFQAGVGIRDVSAAYRGFGHEVRLERYCYSPDTVADHLEATGLREVSRLVRRSLTAHERDDQAMLLARLG
ncbi:class I SAM-dependent methyltransferase [Nocardioides insulae]|uniref:class I SAM-dependent methyltransferase n=1 Tax=Nocardioides insulae TaxID=394734 RepID=UPI00041459B9|nr:class I SAM-dependent methyltransferase [Nocardioides insulae]